MSTVFISYSHVDANSAAEVRSVLSNLGIDYFHDEKDIHWGDSIPSKVRNALDTCAAILVVVSPASLKSPWVTFEIGYASAKQKPVLLFLTHPSLEVPSYIHDRKFLTDIQKVKDYFANRFIDEMKDISSPVSHSQNPRQKVSFTDLQIKYLLDISKPRNEGCIYGGIDEHTGREAALYQEALKVFQEYGVMQYSGDGYKLTSEGWKLVDQLWALNILDALDLHTFVDQKELARAVGLTEGQMEQDELERHVKALEEDSLVIVNRTMRGDSTLRISDKGLTRRKHRKIDL